MTSVRSDSNIERLIVPEISDFMLFFFQPFAPFHRIYDDAFVTESPTQVKCDVVCFVFFDPWANGQIEIKPATVR
jgi:hypothetical protein